KKDEKKGPVKVAIDFDGITQRIVALPPKAAGYDNAAAGKSGQTYYTKGSGNPGDEATLQRFDLEKRKEEPLAEKVDGFELSADGKRMLLVTKDGWSLDEPGEKLDLTKFRLPVDKLQVKVDPRAEWKQIYEEAWRINRDFFYDPNMHGADWPAIKNKYEPFIAHCTSSADTYRVIGWMLPELAVEPSRYAAGERAFEKKAVP